MAPLFYHEERTIGPSIVSEKCRGNLGFIIPQQIKAGSSSYLVNLSSDPSSQHTTTRKLRDDQEAGSRSGMEKALMTNMKDVSGASVEQCCISYLGFNHYETLGM